VSTDQTEPEDFGSDDPEGMRQRAQKAGEQAVGDLAQALLENPLFSQAVSAGFAARDKALGAQHAAMGALNLPSASEVERLERRLRSVSQRLETVEEQVDRIARDVAAIRRAQEASEGPPADQKRLSVED
jgi:chromosome segregation ATPase